MRVRACVCMGQFEQTHAAQFHPRARGRAPVFLECERAPPRPRAVFHRHSQVCIPPVTLDFFSPALALLHQPLQYRRGRVTPNLEQIEHQILETEVRALLVDRTGQFSCSQVLQTAHTSKSQTMLALVP